MQRKRGPGTQHCRRMRHSAGESSPCFILHRRLRQKLQEITSDIHHEERHEFISSCAVLLFIHQGAVIIHEINDGGAAQRDGRLQAGDQILEVLTYSVSGGDL